MDSVESLDLGPIKYKLMDPQEGEGWSLEEVTSAEREYKRFLILNRENEGTTIVPSKKIDKFWHYHILDTAKYADDCDAIFGKFLHHFPYFGLRGEDDAANLRAAFEATKATYKARFGEEMLATSTKSAGECCGCGSVVCSVGSCNDGYEVRPEMRPSLLAA
jgi:hypothetical protein